MVHKREYDITFYDERHAPIERESLSYQTGQPMGALSSWAMLAITHHLIVQKSWRMAYPSEDKAWFTDYEILGDDIVIFDKLVADTYLSYMRLLGVEINLSKSVVSNNGSFEFAKNTYYKTHNISGIP